MFIRLEDIMDALSEQMGRNVVEAAAETWLGKTRTREEAGKNEKEDISFLVDAIHTQSPAGMKIIENFKAKFGLDILDAKARSGNRAVHYDFSILVGPRPGQWLNVEHKGSKDYVPIGADQSPWAAGVQFHNGGCEKYTIAKDYAKVWYDMYIGSGELKREWNLSAEIPSFDVWFQQDAKTQGDPKTKFGIELKSKVRAAGKHLRDKRAAVNLAFNPTQESLTRFKQETQTILNEILNQKDYWLTIHGDLTKNFHCAWWPKFTLPDISSVVMRKEKDIWFDFVCGEQKFSCILRSGKALFSNFRIDARDTP